MLDILETSLTFTILFSFEKFSDNEKFCIFV